MNCCCKVGELNDLKIEGDVGADPIWCNRCGCNLDMEDLMISNRLAKELAEWAMKYGAWIDWDEDRLIPGGIELEQAFNKTGVILTEKVNGELNGKYDVSYTPSTSAVIYNF